MQTKYGYIKLIVLLLIVGFLFAFSNMRNEDKKVVSTEIKFLGANTLFITENTVSKLLIQNQQAVTDLHKEIIDLNELETALNSNPMIKKAQVFMSVDGELSAEIEQKQPVARVSTDASYYIDDEGLFMPLSTNYSARVPLVTGKVNRENLDTVFQFAKTVYEDEFLRKHVIGIHQNEDDTIDFKIRKSQVVIHLGDLSKLDKKLNNFKVFYQKAIKDNILNNYKTINLKFDEQVICTKK